MNLYLRKVIHPQAHDNYRVVLKLDEGEFEIGSIGIMHAAGVQHLTTTPSWEHPVSESLTCARRNLTSRPLGTGAANETPMAGGTPLPMPKMKLRL